MSDLIAPVATPRHGSPSTVDGSRWRCPTTARRCSRRCATTSGALAQGRVQPPGPVRVLHGAGRRCPAGGVRDAGPAGGRVGSSPPSTGSTTTIAPGGPTPSWPPAPASAASARRGSCAPRGPPGEGHGARRPRRGRPGARRPPVPLHRVADHRRGLGGRRVGRVGRPRPRSVTTRDLDAAGRRATIEGGVAQRVGPEWCSAAAGFADDTAPADALVAVPDGSGGWAVGRDADRGAGRGREGPGPPQHGRGPAAARAARRRLGAHPSHQLGRAGLPRDRRLLVRAGRRAGRPARPTAVRSAARSPRPSRPPPASSPTGTGARSGCCCRGRTPCASGPKRPPIAAGVRADGTGVVRVVRTTGIADAVRSVAPGPGGRGGRRRRARRPRRPSAAPAGSRRPCSLAALEARPTGADGGGHDGPCRCAPTGAAARGVDRAPTEWCASSVRLRARCSTRSCCGPTSSAPPTWRWAGSRSEGLAVDADGAVERPDHPVVRDPAGRRTCRWWR